MVEHQLGGHSLVELTTISKALLERQHKHLNHFIHRFFCFKFARFDFACFNFDLYVLPCSKVPRLLWRRRNIMESLVQPLGRSRSERKEFSTLRNKFCKKILVDGIGNFVILGSMSRN